MKHQIEEWAMVLVIKDENGKVVEELSERNPGGFPFWNEHTMERAKKRILILNK
tara:strand:+ start:354 stop:515 length:162 start_codon:yes stop_codon:yes gene_type:complete